MPPPVGHPGLADLFNHHTIRDNNMNKSELIDKVAVTAELNKASATRAVEAMLDGIAEALKAEGVPGLMPGYQTIHRLPIFTEQCAYGTGSFPWSLRSGEGRNFAYGNGTCPVAEDLHDNRFLGINLCMFQFPSEDVAAVVGAFHKVWNNLDALR